MKYYQKCVGLLECNPDGSYTIIMFLYINCVMFKDALRNINRGGGKLIIQYILLFFIFLQVIRKYMLTKIAGAWHPWALIPWRHGGFF